MTFLVFTFYQHFIDRKESKRISKNLPKALFLGFIVNTIIMILFFVNKDLLIFDHSYLYMGILAVIPLIITCILYPKLLNKFLYITLFFSVVFFMLEIVGVYNHYWSFNGSFLLRNRYYWKSKICF